MPDLDGNYNTWVDRFPITFMLRNQKARWPVGWYIVVLTSLYSSGYSIIRSWGSWWLLLTIFIFIFLNWLFIHVDLTTDTGIWRKDK
jgi:hypothetical protein